MIWTYVAYMGNADDAGVWGTRTDTENSLQNIKEGGARAELDPRLIVDRERDAVVNKRMASVFHDSLIPSLLVWHKVDTVILTGGSTSGCVRASSVSSLSHGYRTIVPEECVADKHEIPHFANLCDIMLKYADVEPFAAVADWLENHPGCAPIRRARGVELLGTLRAGRSSALRLPRLGRAPADPLAGRRQGRLLGSAQRRVLRTGSAAQPDTQGLAAPDPRYPGLRNTGLRQPGRPRADDGSARPPRRTRFGEPVGGALRASSRDHRHVPGARLGVLQPRHLQHPATPTAWTRPRNAR